MIPRRAIVCRNGTVIRIYEGRSEVDLPSGRQVVGEPQYTDGQRDTAERLGYGRDDRAVMAMVEDHDPLHACLADWLGLPTSLNLEGAVGGPLTEPQRAIAAAEEEAVLAVQRFMRLAGAVLPGTRLSTPCTTTHFPPSGGNYADSGLAKL